MQVSSLPPNLAARRTRNGRRWPWRIAALWLVGFALPASGQSDPPAAGPPAAAHATTALGVVRASITQAEAALPALDRLIADQQALVATRQQDWAEAADADARAQAERLLLAHGRQLHILTEQRAAFAAQLAELRAQLAALEAGGGG